ncbi:MAG TPA: exosome complex exonuclease Rrp41 [Methanomicrobia archaeon]|nr:MAG: exosome complex exonuclease Rrp41 [Thermococci archaeon]RLF98022.1 MAG: exosome complex exonuclease Rrp41 [Thermococci archaeon]HDN81300.1 exosome complex exonuclease Rrp41 [Methanomicrobia archaeon]
MELIKDGIRIDGRKKDELRDIKIEADVLKRADGSAYVEWGMNKVYAAVYGPRELFPRFLRRSDKAILQCKYNMASFSVEERKRPGPDRRSVEISKVTRGALEPVVLTENFPESVINVNIEIVQAEAGTRCAGITCASVALADAGIPMKDLVPACAAGKISGEIVLDLCKEEDNFGESDLPIAMVPRTGGISLLQMDGLMTVEELEEALNLAKKGCKIVYKKQREALRRRYGSGDHD